MFTLCKIFSIAVINATQEQIGNFLRLCLFHLGQSIFQKIQAEHLQEAYADENDTSIREATGSMWALTFVPPTEVPRVFDLLIMDEIPEDFVPVAEYFEVFIQRSCTIVYETLLLCYISHI